MPVHWDGDAQKSYTRRGQKRGLPDCHQCQAVSKGKRKKLHGTVKLEAGRAQNGRDLKLVKLKGQYATKNGTRTERSDYLAKEALANFARSNREVCRASEEHGLRAQDSVYRNTKPVPTSRTKSTKAWSMRMYVCPNARESRDHGGRFEESGWLTERLGNASDECTIMDGRKRPSVATCEDCKKMGVSSICTFFIGSANPLSTSS